MSDVEIVFKRDTITNESENIANEKIKAETKQIKINTILNAAETIGSEKALQMICDEFDVDFKEVKDLIESAKEKDDLKAAEDTLKGIIPEDVIINE